MGDTLFLTHRLIQSCFLSRPNLTKHSLEHYLFAATFGIVEHGNVFKRCRGTPVGKALPSKGNQSKFGYEGSPEALEALENTKVNL